MQLTRCPVCHSRINLEALVQDASGRDLLALLADLDTLTGSALISYLGLFRPAARDLANDRALRLAREVLDLSHNTARIAIALSETVELLRAKHPRKPLTGHNYLKRVLESVEARPVIASTETTAIAPKSKTGQAYMALESLKQDRS